MPLCSSPVQCQTAKRELCDCQCGGANHGVLRALLDSENTQHQEDGRQQLKALRQVQVQLKKQKKVQRRKNRAALKKMTPRELVTKQFEVG